MIFFEDQSVLASPSSFPKFTRPLWDLHPHHYNWWKPLRITVQPKNSSQSDPHPSFSVLLLVSLSGEVMWGTSCGPYLSRPFVLILPWLFGCQEEQAGRQSSLGEYSTRRVSRARALGGLGNLALLTSGLWWNWKLGAVRHWTLPKRAGSGKHWICPCTAKW